MTRGLHEERVGDDAAHHACEDDRDERSSRPPQHGCAELRESAALVAALGRAARAGRRGQDEIVVGSARASRNFLHHRHVMNRRREAPRNDFDRRALGRGDGRRRDPRAAGGSSRRRPARARFQKKWRRRAGRQDPSRQKGPVRCLPDGRTPISPGRMDRPGATDPRGSRRCRCRRQTTRDGRHRCAPKS